jgi:heme-degrading monooxygenase HmoA
MIFRIWRTTVDATRWDEYARFEQEHSLPMFQQLPGCLGVFFVRLAGNEAAACTLWHDQAAIDRLTDDPLYQRTVAQLEVTGLLEGTQRVEVMLITDAWLAIEKVAMMLIPQ